MNTQQTAAGTIFLYSWALLLLGHFLPKPFSALAVSIAVLIAGAAMMLALAIAFDEKQHHRRD